jgi:hypothetical protein
MFEFSDNICTVGWTCIHGYITPDEMQMLKSSCPRGDFHVTFLPDKSINNADEARAYFQRNPYSVSGKLPMYFDFPLDGNGARLLRQLGFDPEKAKFWKERSIVSERMLPPFTE